MNMKMKFYSLFIVALGFTIAWSSCRKYEQEPEDWFTSELTFDTLDKNGVIAGFALNNIYTYIPNGFTRVNGDFLDAATDDAVPSRFNTNVENIAKGAITANSNPEENTGNEMGSYWDNCYYGIRRDIFLVKKFISCF